MTKSSRIPGMMAALAGLALSAGLGCSQMMVPDALDQEHAPRTGEGWISLFNGENLEGWHKRADHGGAFLWTVEDGAMVNKLEPGQHGSDIVTDEKFRDFELYYEYLVPEGSNSGMYLRGLYEIQIRGDGGKSADPGTNGGIWATAAPMVNASKPGGKWQSTYVKFVGMTVKKVVLNGQLIHENVKVAGPTGGDLRKTVDVDGPGPIMIQGDHGAVKVRHIYIKPLDESEVAACTACQACK